MTRAAVFGTGNWGTAFAGVLADAGCEVRLWGRRPELVEALNVTRENAQYLPGRVLPEQVRATTDPAEAAAGAEVVVLAVPSQTLRENLAAWAPSLGQDAILVSLMKGIELGTGKRMSEVIGEVAGWPSERTVVISGPNLATEIAQKQPAATVVACVDLAAADLVAEACNAPYLRPYTQTDVVGTELGGAFKNVIALAAGMAQGLGFGDNTKSMLITRGLAETARLGAALGADPTTFMGLAGAGDLIATCMSPLSRNHMFGVSLGQGRSVADTAAAMAQTAEGVKSCVPLTELARRNGVEVPIAQSVVEVVQGRAHPRDLADLLMARTRKAEHY